MFALGDLWLCTVWGNIHARRSTAYQAQASRKIRLSTSRHNTGLRLRVRITSNLCPSSVRQPRQPAIRRIHRHRPADGAHRSSYGGKPARIHRRPHAQYSRGTLLLEIHQQTLRYLLDDPGRVAQLLPQDLFIPAHLGRNVFERHLRRRAERHRRRDRPQERGFHRGNRFHRPLRIE